jgi:hypothetical protein
MNIINQNAHHFELKKIEKTRETLGNKSYAHIYVMQKQNRTKPEDWVGHPLLHR